MRRISKDRNARWSYRPHAPLIGQDIPLGAPKPAAERRLLHPHFFIKETGTTTRFCRVALKDCAQLDPRPFKTRTDSLATGGFRPGTDGHHLHLNVRNEEPT